jgi:hypothetical protein
MLDDLLRGDVRRLLTAAGYQGHGKTVRRPGPEGSLAIIAFDPLPATTTAALVSFRVDFGVYVPKARPWLSADLQSDLSARRRNIAESQALARLLPSPSSSWSRLVESRDDSGWGLTDNEPLAPIAEDLIAGLREQVLPTQDHLLDVRSGPFDDNPATPRIRVLRSAFPFTRPKTVVVDGGLYAWPEPNPTHATIPAKPAPAPPPTPPNHVHVRTHADGPTLAVEIGEQLPHTDAIYRQLGARRLRRDGSFSAQLDPEQIWMELQGVHGILHIRVPALAEYQPIYFPRLSQPIRDLAAVFPVGMVISLGASLLPGLTFMKTMEGAREGRLRGGMLTVL